MQSEQAEQPSHAEHSPWPLLPPEQEAARIAELHSLDLLDTAPEAAFDALTGMAARACHTPIALVSLVDEQRQWFKSRVGLDVSETPREMAFCNYALDRTDPFVVSDTATDQRFCDNALVTGDPNLRAYAGAPLITPDGNVLGTLCVLDQEPREFTSAELEMLSDLARQVVEEIELRRKVVALTEELSLADALRVAEERWRLTFDSSPVGIALITPSGRFEQANRALCEMLGRPWEALRGTDAARVAHPGDAPGLRDLFADLIAGERDDVRLQHRCLRADGVVIWVQLSAALVSDPSGRPLHVVVHVNDVTEEQRAKERLDSALEELATRQAFVETLLDTVEVGIVACDQDGRLRLFNRAAREWHGIDKAGESTARDLDPSGWADQYDLFEADGETRLAVDRIPLIRAAQGQSVAGDELQIKPAHAPPVHVSCVGRAIEGPDGTPLGAVVAMSDVTEDRARTRALVEAQTALAARTEELQRSNTELEQFALVASHDLQSPLSVMRGYLGVIAEEYEHVFDDRTRAWLNTIDQSADRMSSLLRALLSYARAESGPPLRAPVDLDSMVALVLDDLSSRLEGAEVTVSRTEPSFTGDPELVRQLVQNLVANALRHRDPDRPCRVDVGVERLPAGQDGWLLTVADNGPGIPPERRDAVFRMFSRGEPSLSGHGIGLATCERIAQRHGGSIWIEDTPGGGATIRCTLFAA